MHEFKLKISKAQAEGDPDVHSEEDSELTKENIHRKYKRLSAQKEVDRTISVACQSSSDLLNRAGHLLQKAAPLSTVPHILSEHFRLLEQIHVPTINRVEGSVPLLNKMIGVTSTLDEVAKYSLLNCLQKRVWDHENGERIIDMLWDATSELDADIESLVSTPRDTNFGGHIMNILAHNNGLKKLSSCVSRICSDRENFPAQFGEDIAKKCVKILASRDSELGQFRPCKPADGDHMFAMQALQDNLLQNVKKLGTEISDIEVIEDKIRTFYDEIRSSREFQVSNNFLAVQRVLQHKIRPIPVAHPLSENPPTLFNESLLDFEMEARMEKLGIDAQENSTALEYLSSLEFGVDGSKIHSTSLIPTGNVDEVVNELATSETFLSVCE